MSYSEELIQNRLETLGYELTSKLVREFAPFSTHGEGEYIFIKDVISTCPNKNDCKHTLIWSL